MIFICPLDICAYKLNSFFFFLFNNIHNKKIQPHTTLFLLLFVFSSFLFSFLFSFTSTFTQSTNYKKNSKLHKYYIRQIENYKIIQKSSGKTILGAFWVCLNTGGAWVHVPPPMKIENQWIGNVFFFPLFLRRR